jgi:glutamyl-tRNA reductase
MTISKLALAGFSHKTASSEVREALARLKPAEVLESLREAGCPEAVVLSTCNRFEVAVAGDGEPAARLLERAVGLRPALKTGHEAVSHLFTVSAGLDSMVVGETEILGQVKAAYELSLSVGMTGKQLNVLFQRALFVGKKVRSETGIAVGQTSVASVAVQLAGSIFGGLEGREVLVLGAGAMAEVTVRHLLGKRVSRVCIANRTFERAAALAERFDAGAIPWKDFPEELTRADIVIASTGSTEAVVTAEMVSQAMQARSGRPLFIIDIAMPRDVEEGAHALENVYLYRLEHLEALAAENLRGRQSEIDRARELVRTKAQEFSAWADAAAAGREASMRHAV